MVWDDGVVFGELSPDLREEVVPSAFGPDEVWVGEKKHRQTKTGTPIGVAFFAANFLP